MPKAKLGGYRHRAAVNQLIRAERAEMDDLLRLVEAAATPETGKILRRLVDGKLARIELLYALLEIREQVLKEVRDEETDWQEIRRDLEEKS